MDTTLAVAAKTSTIGSLDIATIVNIILCILSFILALISVITVVITLKQNNKMLESSTRPVLSLYTTQINTGSPVLYFVVKNFGGSTAVIKSIESNHDFTDFLIGCDQLSKEDLNKHNPISLLNIIHNI